MKNIRRITCKNCEYYIAHYAKEGKDSFLEVYFGHCINKVKPLRPDTEACAEYNEKVVVFNKA